MFGREARGELWSLALNRPGGQTGLGVAGAGRNYSDAISAPLSGDALQKTMYRGLGTAVGGQSRHW